MADIVVDRKALSLDISDAFDGYSKVVLKTGETDDDGNDIAYISGNDSGRTLEVTCPWGSQTVADNILAKIEGWAYQPMVADGASVNPAFEVGDSIVVGNTFSGIYSSDTRFSRLFTADVKAPTDEEINHEYQYESKEERTFSRKINDAVARMNFYADAIEAKVDRESAGTTFGWRIDEDSWDVFNQGGTLFSINSNGAYVKGEIQAGSGKIGGFTINSTGLSTNGQTYGGEEQTGVYIGSNGIQLGTKFRVDSQGNLYASSGHFDGNVYAKNIQYGGSAGYFDGSGISAWSIGTGQFMNGVNISLGWADFASDVFNKVDQSEWIYTKRVLSTMYMSSPTYYVDYGGGQQGSVNTHTHYVEVSGNTVTIGSPDFSGTPHPFDVAGSATVQSTTLNGTPTYRSANKDYAVPVKVTLSNGNTSTTTLYVKATDAYNAGYDKGYDYAFDHCVVGYYYTSSWGSNNYYVIFANIDGQRAADVSVYVDNNAHIYD